MQRIQVKSGRSGKFLQYPLRVVFQPFAVIRARTDPTLPRLESCMSLVHRRPFGRLMSLQDLKIIIRLGLDPGKKGWPWPTRQVDLPRMKVRLPETGLASEWFKPPPGQRTQAGRSAWLVAVIFPQRATGAGTGWSTTEVGRRWPRETIMERGLSIPHRRAIVPRPRHDKPLIVTELVGRVGFEPRTKGL